MGYTTEGVSVPEVYDALTRQKCTVEFEVFGKFPDS